MFNNSDLFYADYPTRLDREYRQAIAENLTNILLNFAKGFACLVLISLLGCFCLAIFHRSQRNRPELDETEPFEIFHPDSLHNRGEDNGQRRQLH